MNEDTTASPTPNEPQPPKQMNRKERRALLAKMRRESRRLYP